MTRLLDDLLDVSRILRDNLTLSKKVVQLREILTRAIDVTAGLVEERKHCLQLDIPLTSMLVEVDASRMTQVFVNLLNNAARYTGPEGEIRVRAQAQNGKMVVTIEDTGVGIAREALAHIFELFARKTSAPDASPLRGFGIGLSVAKRLVEAHGGDIRAESEGPGLGSRFIVTLPRAKEDLESPRAMELEVQSTLARKRILVVDDNEDAAEMLGEVLRALGQDVRTAADGLHALEAAEEFIPDVVFLDIGLPVMDGYEIARCLRRIPACASIPIVAVSGYTRERDRQAALEAGFTEYFAKPISIQQLTALLARPQSDRPDVQAPTDETRALG